jgi:hypothetical protein
MNTTPAQSTPVKIDVGISLAAASWDAFCQGACRAGRPPRSVSKLKSQRPLSKSGVYLLKGASEDGSDVVAKRCRRSSAWVERAVYERVLPEVGVSKLHYYGHADELESNFCWLFLKDAGRAKLLESERSLAAAWLARLHGEAARLVDHVTLPERGPAHYRNHLAVARDSVAALRSESSNADEGADVEMLRRLGHLLDRLDSQWEMICAPCATSPRTLVHGDFGKKNLRTRVMPMGTELVVLDWETAGWGPIAADLPQMQCRGSRAPRLGKPITWRGTVPLDAYAACALGAWNCPKPFDLAQLAAVGTIFRYVSSIRWAADQVLGGGTEKPMARLRLYADELPQATATVTR